MSAASPRGHNKRFGQRGEDLVADWYQRNGYTVIVRNWRCRDGEIDLIIMNGIELVICEVKSRTSERYGTPAEAVTWAKQQKLRKLAAMYMGSLDRNDARRRLAMRFDVACVLGENIDVIEHAF